MSFFKYLNFSFAIIAEEIHISDSPPKVLDTELKLYNDIQFFFFSCTISWLKSRISIHFSKLGVGAFIIQCLMASSPILSLIKGDSSSGINQEVFSIMLSGLF